MRPKHRPKHTRCTYHRCVCCSCQKLMPRSQPMEFKDCCNLLLEALRCRRQYYRRELSIPSRILSMVWSAVRNISGLVDTNVGAWFCWMISCIAGESLQRYCAWCFCVVSLRWNWCQCAPIRLRELRTRFLGHMPRFYEQVITECALHLFYVIQIISQVRALALNSALSENIFVWKTQRKHFWERLLTKFQSPGKRELREVDGVPSFLFLPTLTGSSARRIPCSTRMGKSSFSSTTIVIVSHDGVLNLCPQEVQEQLKK